MTAQDFAKAWQAAWNSHDLDQIMRHYREDIVFRSRKALALTGDGTLHGRDTLRAYWAKALKRQPDLRFEVVDVFAGHDSIVITYLNQRGVLAAETLWFDSAGLVTHASACHRDED